MDNIKLSFIVPMYNSEKYLNLCIDSLLNQDIPHEEYEIICINDGSTDKTKEICLEYQAKYKNIHYYEQENRGHSSTRNLGLKYAVGTYIWFIDSDDEILNNCLGNILSEIYSNDLDVLETKMQLGKEYKKTDKKSNFKITRRFRSVSSCVKIVRKDILINNSIYFIENLIYAEDQIWSIQLEKMVNKIEYCRNEIYFYRENENSMTRNNSSRELVFKGLLILLRETKDILNVKDRSLLQRTLIWVIFMSSYNIDEKLNLITILENQGDYPYKNATYVHFRGDFIELINFPFTEIMKNIIRSILQFLFRYKSILILFLYIKEFLLKRTNTVRPTLNMKEIESLYYGK